MQLCHIANLTTFNALYKLFKSTLSIIFLFLHLFQYSSGFYNKEYNENYCKNTIFVIFDSDSSYDLLHSIFTFIFDSIFFRIKSFKIYCICLLTCLSVRIIKEYTIFYILLWRWMNSHVKLSKVIKNLLMSSFYISAKVYVVLHNPFFSYIYF